MNPTALRTPIATIPRIAVFSDNASMCDRVLAAITQHGPVASVQIAELLDEPKMRRVSASLEQLSKAGKIRQDGKYRNPGFGGRTLPMWRAA